MIKPIIASILDNDLYKFTQQWAVLKQYPTVEVEYAFNNRRKSNKFNQEAVDIIKKQVEAMAFLRLTQEEKLAFQNKCPFLPLAYFEYLHNYRFNPAQVQINLTNIDKNGWGDLEIKIKGLWHQTILWEVPLMALVSEVYFLVIDTNWTYEGQNEQFEAKGDLFEKHEIYYSEFGTRRRRSYINQDNAVAVLRKKKTLIGTSNVHLAIKHDIIAMGTVAHEWTMAHQVLCSIQRCNYYALKVWNDVYQGDLSIALTDTIGTDIFFADFDPVLSRLYDGIRHASGDPFIFIKKAVSHYEKHRINPASKTALFSDGLNGEVVLKIHEACQNKILDRYGIGTWITNDFKNSPALNIVIKLTIVNNKPVVKTSDVFSKAIGQKDALRVTRWLVYGTPLDSDF